MNERVGLGEEERQKRGLEGHENERKSAATGVEYLRDCLVSS